MCVHAVCIAFIDIAPLFDVVPNLHVSSWPSPTANCRLPGDESWRQRCDIFTIVPISVQNTVYACLSHIMSHVNYAFWICVNNDAVWIWYLVAQEFCFFRRWPLWLSTGTVVVGRVATGSLPSGSRLVFAPGNVEAQARSTGAVPILTDITITITLISICRFRDSLQWKRKHSIKCHNLLAPCYEDGRTHNFMCSVNESMFWMNINIYIYIYTVHIFLNNLSGLSINFCHWHPEVTSITMQHEQLAEAFSGHMVSVTVDVEMSELKRGHSAGLKTHFSVDLLGRMGWLFLTTNFNQLSIQHLLSQWCLLGFCFKDLFGTFTSGMVGSAVDDHPAREILSGNHCRVVFLFIVAMFLGNLIFSRFALLRPTSSFSI